MPGISLAELADQAVEEIHIHAHEGGIYTVSAERCGQSPCVYGEDGKPLSSRQLLFLRRLLGGFSQRPQYLVHKSAYDEMLGMAPSQAEAMKVVLLPLEEESL